MPAGIMANLHEDMHLLSLISKLVRKKMHNRLFSQSRQLQDDIVFSNGPNMKISTGQYAKLADGSAVGSIGETTVLVTAVSKNKSPSSYGGVTPLTVDYRQKSAAAGRIPTNFFRRDLGPSEREILTSRLIDRSIRPLFPKNFFWDTQIICNALSIDGVNNPDVLAINAASAALSLSDIPWNGPVGAVRLGLVDNEILVNPTRKQQQSSLVNLVVTAAHRNMIVMLEGQGNNIHQHDLLKVIRQGAVECQHIASAIEKLRKTFGKVKRTVDQPPALPGEILDTMQALSVMRITEIFQNHSLDKLSRDNALNDVRTDVLSKLRDSAAGYENLDWTHIGVAYNDLVRETFRNLLFLDDAKRCDGRDLDELRNIECQINMYKTLHGCSLFQRGQTQVFCTVTLDSHDSAMKMDPAAFLSSGIKSKNFFVHYEFPAFATNEMGRVGPAGRREIGHGALAEKALYPVVPEKFPFTIRLTSEVLESNGSSSMATVCGGSLALMDAGVPLASAVAGVAVGLVTKNPSADAANIEDYRILTDILGIEDYMGDMDFKIAGTRKGFTALQADVKIGGIPLKIIMESIQKATTAKGRILDIMNECIRSPCTETKENWPVCQVMEVEIHKRSRLYGPGGINLKKLFAETGVQVIQLDDTTFEVFAPNQQAMDEAQSQIQQWLETDLRTPELNFGDIYKAKIVEIRDIGVMVTLYNGMPPALLHNSQLDQRKVAHPSALGLEVGQELQVKYFGRDPVSGLMRLSRKILQSAAMT